MPGICGLAEGIRFVCGHEPQQILQHEQQLLTLLVGHMETMRHIRIFCGQGQTGVLSF